jgi:hypothetical protein
VRHAHAELLANRAFDVFVRKWLDLILETRERIKVRRRKQVGSGRQNLAKLDECRSERFEVSCKRFRRGRIRRGRLFSVERFRDELSAAVLGHKPGDVPVTPEATTHMGTPQQRSRHGSAHRAEFRSIINPPLSFHFKVRW